jgi:hypothetical protein
LSREKWREKWRPVVPIRPANDPKSRTFALNRNVSLSIDVVVGDIGHISSDQKMELRKQSHTAVLTRVRENMSPPREYFDWGCPECPEGIPLRILGYLSGTPSIR